MGHAWTKWSIFQKVQIFGERSILMKCSIFYGCLNGGPPSCHQTIQMTKLVNKEACQTLHPAARNFAEQRSMTASALGTEAKIPEVHVTELN